jgi:hypothetical protein
MRSFARVALAIAFAGALAGASILAQGRGAAPPSPPFDFAQGAPSGSRGAPPPPTPRAAAPIDLTGYWVSVVNEDYRWRMITPPKGDYASLPLTDEGRKVADSWDPSQDGRCEAYGVGGLMRLPTRLNVTWESDTVLRIETDAGQQTRRLVFDAARPAPVTRTLQGFSRAEWQRAVPAGRGGRGGRGGPPPTGPAPGSSLKVMTTQFRAGWLRRNGVPYSETAAITEYFDRFAAPDGAEWLVVTTIVNDPKYLNQEFVTSSHFKKEPDGSKWSPSPCRAS